MKPNIIYFHPFGCKCFLYNIGKNYLGKIDPRSDKGIFLSYAPISRAFWVFNNGTLNVEECVHVVFDDTNTRMQESEVGEDEIDTSKPAGEGSKVSTEYFTEESFTAKVELTNLVNEVKISKELRHNANYPENEGKTRWQNPRKILSQETSFISFRISNRIETNYSISH